MIEAKNLKNYLGWTKKICYGGYKYIEGRWTKVAKKIIKKFKLNNKSRILDVSGKALFYMK